MGGDKENRKPKCGFVPHGNWEVKKESVKPHSSIAQLPIICIVIYLVALIRFSIATVDIKSAFRQVSLPETCKIDPRNDGLPLVHSGNF